MKTFLRIGSHPAADLARGYSYSMGCFGEESEAHAGLSGYSLDRGVEQAVADLADRMGISGLFRSQGGEVVRMFVTLFEGRDVGTGPDQEELFAPRAIVASWDTRELAGVEDLVERLAALGFVDD